MTTLAKIRTQFAAYNPATTEQSEIKAVLAVYINTEPEISDSECLDGLRDDLPTSLLYSRKAFSGATILHHLLRNYLQLKRVIYSQSTESNRITFGLVDMLYDSQSDRTAALTLLRNAASTSVDAKSPNVGDGNATSHSEPASKIAHSMATRFKIEQKFTGKLGEDLTEYISNYMDAANDYNLTNQQKWILCIICLMEKRRGSIVKKFCPLVQTSLKLLQ
jgi:hypothetical protein